ncbi:hypothetical protein IAT40_006083 [Kwoniella sp. CBS 6097]
MDSLTPDQARALWEAGGFLVITDLPEASEFGIDGTFHIVRRFSGIKFVPPGLHLITWSSTSSPSSSSSPADSISMAGPSNVPIRHALLRHFKPKQRVVLRFDKSTESVSEHDVHADGQSGSVISDDHLRTLDKEMAPYPFTGLEGWKSLTGYITPDILESVIGENGLVDGMTSVEGEEDDSDSKEMQNEMSTLSSSSNQTLRQAQGRGRGQDSAGAGAGKKMRFVRFGLKRSWRDGAIGEEVTRFSRDKSWLLGDVVANQLGGDLDKLLGQLQLSFILLLHLSSYSALLVYKRLLTLICQSPSFISDPSSYLSTSSSVIPSSSSSAKSQSQSQSQSPVKRVKKMYTALLGVLDKQIEAIPNGSFDTELPELDAFFQDQIESLRSNISAAVGSSGSVGHEEWNEVEKDGIRSAWKELENSAKKWGWEIGSLDLSKGADEDSEDEEEEGEYAPVIVDL